MARPNRFDSRNQVRDLQRRQEQGLGVSGGVQAVSQPEIQFNPPPNAARNLDWRSIQNTTWNTTPWYDYTATIPPNGAQTTYFTDTRHRTEASTQASGSIWSERVDIQPRRHDFLNFDEATREAAATMRREIDLQILREMRNLDTGAGRRVDIPPLNPTPPRPAAVPQQPQRPRRTPEETAAFRTGRASRIRASNTKKVYLRAMVLGLPYEGKTYSYTPDINAGVGIWKVSETSVAEIDLDQITLRKIMLPRGTDQLYNLTRFLWRQLGLSAIRYKNKTIVHTGTTGQVLVPGQSWTIPFEHVEPYLEQSKLEQGELFGKSLSPNPILKTKRVDWVNPFGHPFSWGTYIKGELLVDLNIPPRPPEENS